MRLSGLEPKHFVILFALAVGMTVAAGVLTYYDWLPGRLPLGSSMESSQGGTTMEADTASQDAKASELEMLQTHLRTKPEHTPILFRMAQISREMGKLSEAEMHLREILRLEPDNHDARLELGRVLFESGDVVGAIEKTKEILARNPKHVDALYNLGAIYANMNNTTLAREFWEQAVNSDPQSESGQNARRGLEQLEKFTFSFR